MYSIITNSAAKAALGTLRSISQELDQSQSRVTTGYRVGHASDDAAYWSIARTMKSDDKALSAVQDALNLGAATIDIAYTGLSSSIDVVDEIKAKLVAASEPGVDKDKVNKEITQLKDQLLAIAKSSTFNDVNWLNISDSTDSTVQVVGSFTRDTNRVVSMQTIDFDIYGSASSGNMLALIDDRTSATGGEAGILTSTWFADAASAGSNWVLHVNDSNSATAVEIELSDTTTNDELDEMISTVDKMLQQLTNAGADYGALKMRVDLQTDFVGALRDWTTKGVSKLIDADMDEEATRLKALQAREQLTTQALSIANSTPSALLQLFQ
ncbi:flagellin [Neorhizobium huautlense]|uniref:Flagellin n=1 Tax=Neorhizobium huautlense TaxID=67774 RepID=A0ABT9PXG8_9HYPH|nr:flagellin [Neorhizobium huautlense]MDP9839173.1 flagellin [Neorhizobium huautlense]